MNRFDRYRKSDKGRDKRLKSQTKRYWLRRKIFDECKRKPCSDCQGWYEPYQMDFDHRPGTKKEGLVARKLVSWSLDKVWKEVKKCDVVCANCHRERTHKRLYATNLSQWSERYRVSEYMGFTN